MVDHGVAPPPLRDTRSSVSCSFVACWGPPGCADKRRAPYRRAHLDVERLLHENLRAIEALMAHRPDDLALIRGIADACEECVTRLLPRTPPEYGVCHGDLHGGDVRFPKGHTPVLFDFDSSGCGWRALDIGVFLASHDWMDCTPAAEANRQQRLAAFLEGYSTTRTVSDSELAVVRLGPPVRHIFLMGHVLLYTSRHEGFHWANDDFIGWHMKWFRAWADRGRPEG